MCVTLAGGCSANTRKHSSFLHCGPARWNRQGSACPGSRSCCAQLELVMSPLPLPSPHLARRGHPSVLLTSLSPSVFPVLISSDSQQPMCLSSNSSALNAKLHAASHPLYCPIPHGATPPHIPLHPGLLYGLHPNLQLSPNPRSPFGQCQPT